MASPVLTVEATLFQHFLVGLFLHPDCGFSPSRVERLYVVILQLGLSTLIEVGYEFDCVADLEILTDHPCDLPSRENSLVFFAASFKKTLLLKSQLMLILIRSLAI